jgi:hypothetical protein
MTGRFRGFAFCTFAVAALVTSVLWPAFARDRPQAPTSTLPSDSALDALLATRDWHGLATALSQPPDAASLPRALNWLQAKVNDGAGFMIALAYTRDLWMAGNAMNVSDPLKDLRVTAGMMALYAYELVVIDGAGGELAEIQAGLEHGAYRTRSLTLRVTTARPSTSPLPPIGSRSWYRHQPIFRCKRPPARPCDRICSSLSNRAKRRD